MSALPMEAKPFGADCAKRKRNGAIIGLIGQLNIAIALANENSLNSAGNENSKPNRLSFENRIKNHDNGKTY